MGSFAGHIDEGVAFIILAIWWLVNIFRGYIKNETHLENYESKLSYPITLRGRKLPLEICLKILFPLGGFAAEIIDAGSFVDGEGNFSNLSDLQHTTIYFLFVVHGVADLLRYYRLPLITNLEYFTMTLAFFWYGTAFYFHSAPGMEKPPLENQIHRLPIPLTLLVGVASIIEMNQRNAVLPQLLRCYSVLTLGTWFAYASFVLFRPFPFPGSHHNPAWDQWDETNVHFITAAFGIHLIINMTFIMTSYTIWVVYRKFGTKTSSSSNADDMCKYSILTNVDEMQFSDNDLQYKEDTV